VKCTGTRLEEVNKYCDKNEGKIKRVETVVDKLANNVESQTQNIEEKKQKS
jgi:hypothetical protein